MGTEDAGTGEQGTDVETTSPTSPSEGGPEVPLQRRLPDEGLAGPTTTAPQPPGGGWQEGEVPTADGPGAGPGAVARPDAWTGVVSMTSGPMAQPGGWQSGWEGSAVSTPGAPHGMAAQADPRPWGIPDAGPHFAMPGPAQAGPLDWRAGGTQAPAYAPPPHPPGLFGPAPPPQAQHRWGLGAYLLVEAVFLLVSVLLGYLLGGRLTTSAGAVALALSVPTVCAAGLAVLITRLRGNGPRIDLGLRLSRRDVAVGVACGLAGLVITIPASVLYVAIVGADATSAVGEALGAVRAGPALAVTIFVIVVFVAPVCEEIVYRGILWGAVERLGANRWWALAVTTVVFALAHFEFARTPLLLVVAIPIGLARVITGRLSAGVIAHQINNLLPAIVLMLGVLGAVPMT